MHSKKTVLAVLFGLSLFVLGLAVGQGWFTPQPAQAQVMGDFSALHMTYSVGSYQTFLAVTTSGDVYSFRATLGSHIATEISESHYIGSILGGAIPTGQESVGDLKGSYNK